MTRAIHGVLFGVALVIAIVMMGVCDRGIEKSRRQRTDRILDCMSRTDDREWCERNIR